MPEERMRSNICRHKQHNKNLWLAQAHRTAEQFSQENENIRIRMAHIRS